jgi:hypothetical protein
VNAAHAVRERCRPWLENFRGLYLVQLIIPHCCNRLPPGARRDVLRPEFLAAPRADDDVGIPLHDFGRILDDPAFRLLRK